MRKTTFWAAIAAGALMLVGVAGWANSDKRALEAQASTQIEAAQLDAFQMMLNAKNLPSQEFEDFSLVFPSPVTHGRTSVTP
jgi:tRNA U34 5-methylaminomethyl-2-thiouridine-forming methyltransferase MnmC